MEDIEIARNAKLNKINEVAKTIGLEDDDIEMYGKYKAKNIRYCHQQIRK